MEAVAYMDVRSWLKVKTWRLDSRLWFLICATFASYFAFLISTPVTLISIACLVAAFAYALRLDRRTVAAVPIPDWLTLGGWLVAYIAISTFWSVDATATIMTAWIIAGLLAVTHIGILVIGRCPTLWLEHATRTLLIAFILALLYFIIDDFSSQAIQKALIWPFRAVRFSSNGLWFDHGTVVEIANASIKWRMPPLGFLLWPALLICALQLNSSATSVVRSIQATIGAGAAWMMWQSNHRTSVAALIAAMLVFALTKWRSSEARRILGGAWIASFVFIIPVVLTLFSLELHKDPRFAQRLDARFILWAYTAEQVKTHPLRGIGAAATKLLNERNLIAEASTPAGFAYMWRSGPHAHNVFLQSWFELGGLGTLLFAAFGWRILNLTASAPPATQPYLTAAFAAVAVTGSTSFGLFEPWFIGTFAMCALTCAMALAYYGRIHDADGRMQDRSALPGLA